MFDYALKSSKSHIHPYKFALWVSMASILMMFGAFTSAYIVRRAAGNWLEFQVPDLFYLSTVILIASSLTLHFSYRSFKAGQATSYRGLLIGTLILGLLFVVLQFIGWEELYQIGVPLDGNPSGSFFYVISGAHAAHVIGGIAALIIALYHAFALRFEVSEKRKTRFQLVLQYWHFVDILWLYLFIFLLVTH